MANDAETFSIGRHSAGYHAALLHCLHVWYGDRRVALAGPYI